jgi:photosystem II stability/assembly factor-like uncharacterized protein
MKSVFSLRLALVLGFVSTMSWAQILPDSLLKEYKYRNVGPNRGGRVTAVAGVVSEKGTFYMGATGGGVWKTTDYGVTWKNVSDGYFASPSIGDINVSVNNPKLIYVGTGSDGLRSNVITGKGMYKSSDAGKTWSSIGLEQTGHIGAVEIHPGDDNIVFVAAIGQAFQTNDERGVFRTKDGGASWEKVLYVADSIGAVDVEFAPDNPNIIYATMWRAERKPWTIISGGHQAGGVYKSTDGGDTWTKKTNGLPQGLIGKIDLAVSAANPEILYALVEAPGEERGMYLSTDRGESFIQVSKDDGSGIGNRPFYYCNVEANPLNANSLYAMANGYFHSTDGGKTWKRKSTPHGDNHDLWINPTDTLTMVQSNDGGANVTTNGGKTWSSQFNQPTAELYQVEADDQYPYWLYAGQQDNSTIALPSLPPYNAPGGPDTYWLAVGGCETGPAVPKPGNPDIVYSNCKGNFGVYNKKTGQEKQYHIGASDIYSSNPKDLKFRFQRVAPIMVSKHNPDAVYMGSQYLHRTMDDGVTWEIISPDLTAFEADKQVISGSPITRDITGEEYYSTIYSIRESPLQEGVIWVGANDGPVHVTFDGGKNWKNVTPEGMPKGGRVDAVEPSPHNKDKAYFATLRYQLGDWQPYIYRTIDGGSSWQLLTSGNNGIPADFPVRVIREDPQTEGLLYAGTEFGLFISFDDGANWQPFQQNLPVTPITDIKVHRGDLLVSTMGRSFWILDDLSSLDDLASQVGGKAQLFAPRETFRYRYRSTSSNSVPFYPNVGVILDYYLPAEPASEISIEVTDAAGSHVRTITSEAPKREASENSGTAMANIRPRQAAKGDLDKSAGFHRFTWDMRHEGPWDSNASRSLRNGPLVAPGIYTFTLSVDGQNYVQKADIKLDPKSAAAGMTDAIINEQVALSLKVVALQSEAEKMLAEIDKELKPLEKKYKKKASSKTKRRIDQLESVKYMLETKSGNYMERKVLSQISYLNRMLNRADQKPGKDAYERYDELKAELDKVRMAYAKL